MPAPIDRYIPAVFSVILFVACTGDGGLKTESPNKPVVPSISTHSTEPTTTIETHRWATRLGNGDEVSLVNQHGDLRVRSAGDSDMQYTAVVQKLDGENRAPDFHTAQKPGDLQIEVRVPDDWHGRVDASARIPAGSRLDMRTDSGLIEVRTGNNDIRARSPTGRFSLRTEGHIEAYGETGDMLIVMNGTSFGDQAGQIKTHSGNIELWLQPQANLTLHTTAGDGLDIDSGDRAVINENANNTAVLTLGDGSARLDVISQQGQVVVRLLPVVQPLK